MFRVLLKFFISYDYCYDSKNIYYSWYLNAMPIHKLKQRLDVKYRSYVIAALLFLAIIAILVRFFLSTGEGIPRHDKVYKLTYDATFTSLDTKSSIRLASPLDTQNAFIIAQTIENPGLQLLRNRSNSGSVRDIVALATSPGSKKLIAEFTIHLTPLKQHKPLLDTSISTMQREQNLFTDNDFEIDKTEVDKIISSFNASNNNQLVESIFKFVNTNIILDNSSINNDASSVLSNRKANTLGRINIMVALCRTEKIPARIVTGFIIEDGFEISPHFWLETYNENMWIPHDPENGYSGELPINFLPVRKGGNSIIVESKAENFSISYDISEQYLPLGQFGGNTKGAKDILDLTRLSLDIRNTIAILLLLPLGVLFTTFCINIIGIRPYGTFSATLLALATIYADWILTVLIFTIIAITGLFGRYLMPDKLSRTPRLAIVFTIVAMSMTLGISIMDYFSLGSDSYLILVPIIILTSLIDQLYKSLDENGVRIAMSRLGWTIAVGIGCYFILREDTLGHLLLAYPEVHFLTIIFVLFLSDYKYKKLSGIPGFKWMGEPKKTSAKKNKSIIEKHSAPVETEQADSTLIASTVDNKE